MMFIAIVSISHNPQFFYHERLRGRNVLEIPLTEYVDSEFQKRILEWRDKINKSGGSYNGLFKIVIPHMGSGSQMIEFTIQYDTVRPVSVYEYQSVLEKWRHLTGISSRTSMSDYLRTSTIDQHYHEMYGDFRSRGVRVDPAKTFFGMLDTPTQKKFCEEPVTPSPYKELKEELFKISIFKLNQNE